MVTRAEEKDGIIHWLRPEYQCRDKARPAKQAKLGLEYPAKPKKKGAPGKAKSIAKAVPRIWPATLPEQFQAVRSALASFGEPATAEQVAQVYARAPRAKVQEILETLAAQGFVRVGEGGEYRLA